MQETETKTLSAQIINDLESAQEIAQMLNVVIDCAKRCETISPAITDKENVPTFECHIGAAAEYLKQAACALANAVGAKIQY